MKLDTLKKNKVSQPKKQENLWKNWFFIGNLTRIIRGFVVNVSLMQMGHQETALIENFLELLFFMCNFGVKYSLLGIDFRDFLS